MQALILTVARICLFRAKPQDLPYSPALLGITVIATIGLFSVRNSQIIDTNNIFAFSIAQVALLGAGLWVLLALFSKRERWIQAATALFGSASLVLVAVMPFLMSSPQIDLETVTLTTLIIVISSFWYFAVIVFIIRETLEVSVSMALVISLVLELSFTIVLLRLFGN